MAEVTEKESLDKMAAEKAKLEDKVKNLSKIIEMMGSQQTSGADDAAIAAGDQLKTNFEGLKKAIGSLETKMKKSDSNPKAAEEIKALVGTIQQKIAGLDTLPTLVETMKSIEAEIKKTNTQQAQGVFGAFGIEPPGKSKDNAMYMELKSMLEEFKATTQEQLQDLDKRTNGLAVRMDTKTMQTLEKFATSADDILNNMVPAKVRMDVDKILSALSFTLSSLTQNVNLLATETEKMNNRLSLSMELLERLGRRLEWLENKR